MDNTKTIILKANELYVLIMSGWAYSAAMKHMVFTGEEIYNGVHDIEELKQKNFDLEYQNNWMQNTFRNDVIELLWAHYKQHGGYTRLAANFIEKLTGQKWERDKEYEKALERIKELESIVNDLSKLLKTVRKDNQGESPERSVASEDQSENQQPDTK